jgi:hypothetical protein
MPWYQTFLNDYQGLLQRIAAVIAFGPIAVGAWYLGQRVRSVGSNRRWVASLVAIPIGISLASSPDEYTPLRVGPVHAH